MTIDVASLVGTDYSDATCYVLARAALAQIGVHLPEQPAELLRNQDAFGRELEEGEVFQEGDVLELDYDEEGRHHLGVCLDAFRFVHTYPETGAVVEAIGDHRSQVRASYRPRGLEK